MAGWVGNVRVTGLNMLPVSQLDGGHVAYSLLDRGAHTLARGLLVIAILFVLYYELYSWVVMLIVVIPAGRRSSAHRRRQPRIGPAPPRARLARAVDSDPLPLAARISQPVR